MVNDLTVGITENGISEPISNSKHTQHGIMVGKLVSLNQL